MLNPIIVHGSTFAVDGYKGTDGEAELLRLALCDFGFLLKPVDRNAHRVSFGAFADAIEASYDLSNPKNNEVVQALRSLQARNS